MLIFFFFFLFPILSPGFCLLPGLSESVIFFISWFPDCSDGLCTGDACLCWRLVYWDELGALSLEEKVHLVSWEWYQIHREANRSIWDTEMAKNLGLLVL